MDKKIVIFNALQTTLSGGIGRYSFELSKAIYNSHKIDFKIVIREEDKLLFLFAKEEDLIIVNGIKNSKSRNYYEQFVLPRKVYKEYPSAIIHYPDTMAPLLSKNKVFITVHDVSFKAMKSVFTFKTRLWKNIITKLSLRKAYKIIADTNFTKNEILKYYSNVHKSNIIVVYCGFNDFSKNPIDDNKINPFIFKLSEKEYLLTVSTISPRKNIDGLIKAFNLIKDRVDCNLIVVGKNGWMFENVYKIVDELKIKNRIFFTGGINDDELKFLYKNAKIFVYPSFYEGFGLPPLEAMSYGIPCAVSNSTSIPEVVKDAALKFDPKSLEDMASSILKLLNEVELKDKILNQSKDVIVCYSWEKCACDIIDLYIDLQ